MGMYQIGDYVVKPINGVCNVKAIMHPDFVDDKKKLYYLLMPLSDKNTKIYVPVDMKDDTVRAVMTEKDAEALIRRIPKINKTWVNNEKERERSYKEVIQSNDPERLVGVIKLIYQRKKLRQEQGKRTTVVDERYFDIAENLLYSELEVVMKKNRNEINDLIKECCGENA